MQRIIIALPLVILCLGLTQFAEAQYIGTTHVIPQVADGQLAGGSGYVSWFLVTKVDSGTVNCTFTPRGFPLSRLSDPSLSMGPSTGGYTGLTVGLLQSQPFASGFVAMSCSGR